MPFDSNGVFSRVMNWTSDMQNGIAIECGRHDAEDNNFAEGFNDTFCRDGRAAATGNFNLGNHKIQKLASGTATTDAVNKGQLDAVADSVSTLDGNVVHLAGTETITGAKTFTQNITRENANLTKGTNPSSTSWTSIEFTDKNGSGTANRSGTIETTIYTSGNVMTALSAFKWAANSTDYARIAVYYPASGEPYTEAPTPTATTSTSSQQIATAGWVNSTGNNVVHLSGTETITGAKTFTYSPTMSFSGNYARGYRIENTNITRGTAPSDYVKWEFTAQDSTSANAEGRLGSFEVMYRPDGAIVSSMRAFQPAASTTQNPYTDAYIQLIYPASGNPYTTAPASDTANSIVTTVAKSKAANGYFQFGNGMIIQWGKLASTSSSITFPKAFSNTNYAISIFALTDTQDTQKTVHSIANGKTTTGISWLKVGQHDSPADNQSGYTHNWIAIGY